MKTRYYATVEPYNDNTEMLLLIALTPNAQTKTFDEYERETGYTPKTQREIRQIISNRVTRGIRGFVFDEMKRNGIEIVFVSRIA